MELTDVTIPESVTIIGEYAFARKQLTTVIIPDSVTIIGYGAFSVNQLTTVTIPDSVTTIAQGAFTENQLTTVTIPNSVTTIGDGAFSYNQLTKITIPNSVTTIGDRAFFGNSELREVILPKRFENNINSIFNTPNIEFKFIDFESRFNFARFILGTLERKKGRKNNSKIAKYLTGIEVRQIFEML
jgi:hypothetical protein